VHVVVPESARQRSAVLGTICCPTGNHTTPRRSRYGNAAVGSTARPSTSPARGASASSSSRPARNLFELFVPGQAGAPARGHRPVGSRPRAGRDPDPRLRNAGRRDRERGARAPRRRVVLRVRRGRRAGRRGLVDGTQMRQDRCCPAAIGSACSRRGSPPGSCHSRSARARPRARRSASRAGSECLIPRRPRPTRGAGRARLRGEPGRGSAVLPVPRDAGRRQPAVAEELRIRAPAAATSSSRPTREDRGQGTFTVVDSPSRQVFRF
jgi:hypothetical protein